MKPYFSFSKIVVAALLTASVFGFSAFRQKQKGKPYSFRKESFSGDRDTSSRKRNRTAASGKLDKLEDDMKQLDIEMMNLEKKLNKIDFSDLQNDLNEKLQKIDVERIQKEIDESFKDAEWQKLNKGTEKALAESKREIAEAKKSLKKVQSQWQLEAGRVKIDTEKINADVKTALNDARRNIESAKEEIQNVRSFATALEKGGLINKSKGYKIEVRNGELYIDGKKQPKEVSDKYRQFYKKKDMTINMGDEDGVRI